MLESVNFIQLNMEKPQQYRVICDKISKITCTSDELDVIKQKFANDINSARRLSNVLSLKDLITVLEKRDCVNDDNIEKLRVIAAYLEGTDVLRDINNYGIIIQDPVMPVLPKTSTDVTRRMYDSIAQEIGTKWKEFARALNIREGHIDTLEDRFRRIPDCVYEVLYYYEDNCDKRLWLEGLLEALVKARRNDLRKTVSQIYWTH